MNVDLLMKDFRSALNEVEEKHDVTIKMGVFRYGNDDFHFKVEGRREGLEPKTVTDYGIFAPIGMPPLHSEIMLQGTWFTISGWKTSARKNKVVITRNNDRKSFVCSVRAVENSTKRS